MELLNASADEYIISTGLGSLCCHKTEAMEFLMCHSYAGDFGSLSPPPTPFTGTAFYYFNAILLARLATALGESANAEARRVFLLLQLRCAIGKRAFLFSHLGDRCTRRSPR